MLDKIEKIGNSTIQHGKYNDRIYLMKLDPNEIDILIPELERLAKEHGYSKLFAKIHKSSEADFKDHGFEEEAFIPKFYEGKEQAVFLGKFLSPDRAFMEEEIRDNINKNIDIAKSKMNKGIDKKFPEGLSITKIPESDAGQLADLYKSVFPTYPFPIHDADYLLEVMKTHVDFFGVYDGDNLVAAASAEMDHNAKNAEMTDFATDPNYLGKGLALFILDEMDRYIKEKGYPTVYTIARSMSPGMNITFAKLGYEFTGTLVNNTNISGNIESMNIWYKNF